MKRQYNTKKRIMVLKRKYIFYRAEWKDTIRKLSKLRLKVTELELENKSLKNKLNKQETKTNGEI